MTAALTLTAVNPIDRAEALCPGAIRPPLLRRVVGPAWLLAFAAVLVWFAIDLNLTPQTFSRGFESLGRFFDAMVPPHDGGDFWGIVQALGETFAMAFAGTALGAALAAPLGLLAAKTIVPNALVHFIVRRTMDLFRGIPALVWALILVAAFGLGPFAGVLALAFADIPRLGKLYAEALENVDERQQEAVRAAGAGPALALRFGAVPQAAPVWLSQTLYYLEQNFRGAAVLGVVGAGGIGFELDERIRIFAFDQVAFILILYVLCVSVLDTASERLRLKLA